MAIERKPRLQPQGIARAKPDGFDFGLFAQRIGQGLHLFGGNRNFHAILTGIARAADPKRHFAPKEEISLHEEEPVNAGDDARNGFNRFRPLQREQGAVFEMVDIDGRRQIRAQIGDVLVLYRAIDDHIEPGRGRRDHQVIKHASIRAKQQRIAHPPFFQRGDIAGNELFERCRDPFARKDQLPHMADIEKACALARPLMFGHDAFILDRHCIASERHHAGALGTVPVTQW